MAVPQQSPSLSRQRYGQAFQSSIFDPPPTRSTDQIVPAGKRRDLTTSEMFGSHEEKDLKSMPKTFVPKEDNLTARQKMIHFLRSDVLPGSEYLTTSGLVPVHSTRPEIHEGQIERQRRITESQNEDGMVDPSFRRQIDLSSQLFGRGATPDAATRERAPKLLANDFSWHSHPESVRQSDAGSQIPSNSERAYQQKSSSVLNYQTPKVSQISQADKQSLQEEQLADVKRRSNVYYSDLNGRSTPMATPEDEGSARRPRTAQTPELKHVIHQDWSDSKTEIIAGHSQRPSHPSARRYDELHQARIFHPEEPVRWEPRDLMGAVRHDNLDKVRFQPGMTCQQVHQAHLRTSVARPEFYEEAESAKHWEVAELHISGLPSHANDAFVRELCQGFELQIVRAISDIDPVRNLCKGRAKIMVRYNPMRDSVLGLVEKLEAMNFRVEM